MNKLTEATDKYQTCSKYHKKGVPNKLMFRNYQHSIIILCDINTMYINTLWMTNSLHKYLSFLRTLYLCIISENRISLRHPVKHSLVQNMLKIFMAVCLLHSVNDEELNILFYIQL